MGYEPEIGSLEKKRDPSLINEEEIRFLDYSPNYFVSFVDMVNSTEIASHLIGREGVRKYYSLFINAIASMARESGARVIKNAGDCLVLYFPQTSETGDSRALRQALECCLDICGAHSAINSLAKAEGLPPINYRVSADYGNVELAKSKTSSEYDLIGPTMNLCSKINSLARPNGLVIGGDLQEILSGCSSFDFSHEYKFDLVGEYSAGLKCAYPVFSVTRKAVGDLPRPTSGLEQMKYRVMVIDDEADVLMTFSTMLSSTGTIEVESFTDSLEALRQFLARDPGYFDLVIADIRMPKLNGIQLSRILRALHPDIHILLVTAHDIVEEISSMLPEIPSENIVSKPLSQEKFLAKVLLAMARKP